MRKLFVNLPVSLVVLFSFVSMMAANIEILKSPENSGYVVATELSHVSHAQGVDTHVLRRQRGQAPRILR